MLVTLWIFWFEIVIIIVIAIQDYAPGLYQILIYLRDKYGDPLIYITENGISSEDGLVDDMRSDYIRNYLGAVLDALKDGVNVRGYFPWCLMDNFEWTKGYQ